MTFLHSLKSSKKGHFSASLKKGIYRTLMFGNLVSILITAGSCKVNEELAKKRVEKRAINRAYADSVYLAEKHNQFLESEEQNNDLPQGEIDY